MNSFTIIFEKIWPRFQLASSMNFFFLNNLFFTLVVIVISKNKQEFLKFYVLT